VEKACATNIINGIEVPKVIYAPKQMGKSKGDNRYGNERKRNQISAGKSKAIIQEGENECGNLSDLEPSEEDKAIGEVAELQASEKLKVETAVSFSKLRTDSSEAQTPQAEKGKRKAADANDSDEIQTIETQREPLHARLRPAMRARGRGRGRE
jgi:hypothetical protein